MLVELRIVFNSHDVLLWEGDLEQVLLKLRESFKVIVETRIMRGCWYRDRTCVAQEGVESESTAADKRMCTL